MKLEREGYKLVHFESWGGAPHKLASNALHLNGEAIVELVGGRLCVHLKEESAPAWNGEGLPPAGLEVEWKQSSNHEWVRATVIAYFKEEAWISVKGEYPIEVGNPAHFRPIRTPEQIAAEKYEADAADLAEVMTGHRDRSKDCYLTLAKVILDAGYSKQVAP